MRIETLKELKGIIDEIHDIGKLKVVVFAQYMYLHMFVSSEKKLVIEGAIFEHVTKYYTVEIFKQELDAIYEKHGDMLILNSYRAQGIYLEEGENLFYSEIGDDYRYTIDITASHLLAKQPIDIAGTKYEIVQAVVLHDNNPDN